MVSQSRRKRRTHSRGVDLWRQQLGRIDLANEVFELIVRAPKKRFPENISKRKNEHTRLFRLAVHRCLTRHYQSFHLESRCSYAKSVSRLPRDFDLEADIVQRVKTDSATLSGCKRLRKRANGLPAIATPIDYYI